MLACRRVFCAMAQPVATQIDRAAFKQVIEVPAVRVPTKYCNDLMRKLRGFTFDMPKTKCIVHDGNRQDVRLLLLRPDLDPAALSPEVQALLQCHDGCEVCSHEVQLNYHQFSADAVLKKLLPTDIEAPSSFESVGHIAHLNLRAEQLPYKHIIGQVLMDKNPSIKTVVNKLGSIDNEYRVFDMEVVAGEKLFETEISQHGVRFRLDFSQVYWNSRLEGEHNRLVSTFSPSDVVVDIMAGIGPFAVPAALKGCKVYANDLNPASAKYLNLNIQLNRVSGRVLPFNMDGRQFVQLLLATPEGSAVELLAAQQHMDQTTQAVRQQPDPCHHQQQLVQSSQQPGLQANGQTPSPQQQLQRKCSDSVNGSEQTATHQQLQQQLHQQPQQQGKQQSQQQDQQQRKQQQRRQQQPKRKVVAEIPPAIPPGFVPPAGGVVFQHAVMNLPASAVEFLDAFRGAFNPAIWEGRLPWVHVYTFMKNETEADVIARVQAALGGPLDEPAHIHTVRDVSPNKLMLCVTLRVPQAVAFAGWQMGHVEQQQHQQPAEGSIGQQRLSNGPAPKKAKQ